MERVVEVGSLARCYRGQQDPEEAVDVAVEVLADLIEHGEEPLGGLGGPVEASDGSLESIDRFSYGPRERGNVGGAWREQDG